MRRALDSTADRIGVLAELKGDHAPVFLCAFEVEHTTPIYSGIFRLADLLALQPNMDIRLHIVAPSVRWGKVFQELRRPVFSLLDRGPLSETCSYVSYDSPKELAAQLHLSYLSPAILNDYEEEADV